MYHSCWSFSAELFLAGLSLGMEHESIAFLVSQPNFKKDWVFLCGFWITLALKLSCLLPNFVQFLSNSSTSTTPCLFASYYVIASGRLCGFCGRDKTLRIFFVCGPILGKMPWSVMFLYMQIKNFPPQSLWGYRVEMCSNGCFVFTINAGHWP